MSDDRKKRAWPWIVALLTGLAVMYVASFGPACWMSYRVRSARPAIATIYRPILNYALDPDRQDGRIPSVLRWYMMVGGPTDLFPTEQLYWVRCPG